jgi:hypothetical protein
MRTTVSLDPDVAALVAVERARTGETFKEAINRLLRRSVEPSRGDGDPPELPRRPGRPIIDVTDVSAVIAALDDERFRERGIP